VPISELKKKKKKRGPVVALATLKQESLSEWENVGLGDGKWKVDGKEGKWRRVQKHNVFFPDDGSDPIGMPKATRGKGLKKGDEPEEKKDSGSDKVRMMLASLRNTLKKIRALKSEKRRTLSKAQRKAMGKEGTLKGMIKALMKTPPDMKTFKKLQKKMGKGIG